MSSARYDGIILGAGHNALVLTAYLGRCGLKVLCLDRAGRAGGGLATVENPRLPGFLHNTHSFFHRAVTVMPWYSDLELERHGASYIEPDLNVAMILADGRSLQWWTEFEKTADSIAAFSRNDAQTLRRWVDEFRPIVEQIIIPETQSPPLPPEKRHAAMSRTAQGRRLLEVAALSPLEFVEREFEHDAVRAGLLFFNGLREVDLRQSGFGQSIPALLASPRMAQMCLGGSAQLAEALLADIRQHGGEVRTGVEIGQILVRRGKAAGVELAGDERIDADGFVASGLNPQQTFLKLVARDCAPAEVRRQAERFRYNLLAPLFALNVAIDEPPRYTAAQSQPELDRALMVILGLERFEQFHEIVKAHEAGHIPPTVMWGACPTVFDPSQAPPGKHTAFMWEKTPYALGGDAANWEQAGRRHGRELLGRWSQFAPNITEDAVLDWFVRTPLDTEASLPNMHRGDLLVGSFDGGQVGYHRPFAGAGCYRTPIESLYLCGASTHPGGNITGLCGYNAARVIAADLSISAWWQPPEFQ